MISFKNIFLSAPSYTLRFILLFFGIYQFALPVWLDILVVFILIPFFRTFLQAFSVSLFFVISALLFSLAWGDLYSNKIWYREHEKWSIQDGYVKNVRDVIDMPFGDLFAIGENSFSGNINLIREKRSVRFHTDEFGFRNDQSISNANLILVGDSFIVANGTDQKDMPSVWLERFTGIKVANIAHPGDPVDYERRLANMYNKLDQDASVIVFYFEGNDFSSLQDNPSVKPSFSFFQVLSSYYNYLEQAKDDYLAKLYPKDQVIFRIFRRVSYQLNAWIEKSFIYPFKNTKTLKPAEKVVTIPIGNYEVGFFSNYINATSSLDRQTYIFQNKALLSRVKAVFFIPTKSRVYQQFTGSNASNSAFDFLSSKYSALNIPVYDLTNVLQNEAVALLPQGKFVFWRDDTHWNGSGIAVSMSEVANKLRQLSIIK
jgi:hypothetical protein